MTTSDNYGTREGAWRLWPHHYAHRISGGAWHPYDYLQLIGKRLAMSIYKGGGRIIVSAPPRHGKSLFISHWVPVWFLDLFPQKRIILTTYEAEFAAHWGRGVRNEITQNQLVGISIREDSSAAHRWETPAGGGMVTAGIGGPITGRGGDLVIIDDPVKNWEEATSAVYREKSINWFCSTLYTRLEPGATIVVLMTRWHERDLAGYLLSEHTDKWEEIRLPAIAEPSDEEPDPLKRKAGEALCPERYTATQLVGLDNKGGIKGAVGPVVWNGLYRQRPSSLEGGVIKRSYFRFWNELPTDLEYAMSIDCAFEKTDQSSYVVVQVWGKKKADIYLVDQERERMDFVETCSSIRRMSERWPQARLKLIEGKANGPAVVSRMKSEIPGLVKYMPRGSKIARLSSVSPFFQSGNVHVPAVQLCPWVRDYVEELVNMPNSPNDDQADATSQMLDHWFKKAKTAAPAGGTRVSPIMGHYPEGNDG